MTEQREADADPRLEAWLATAPTLPASPAFCERVMQAIEARPLPWRARLRQLLFAPHALRWNLAGAATAVLVVLSVSVTLGLHLGRAPAPMAGAMPVAERVVTVRFEVALPQARQVSLAGDFTRWQPRVPLKRNADGTGIWTAEVRLPPGDHEYIFVVDGKRWIPDPRAARYRDDGFGNRNAVLTVPSV